MPQPNDVTSEFRAGMAGGAVPGFVTARDPAEAQRRFAVYRNNVAHSLRLALARRFPVVERLVGTPFFAALAGEFIAAHPPRSPVLQEWGEDMAAFLTGFGPAAMLPYLPDVARIEYSRGRAYHAADATPLPAGRLQEAGSLHLHPSLHLLRLGHPAVSIWQANQPHRNGRTDASGPETALIWRRPDFDVPVQALAPGDADFIAALQAGHSLEAASQLTDPVPMLTLLLRDGLICEPGGRP